MTTVKQKFDLAFAKHQTGDMATAAQLYRDILSEDPKHIDTLHMFGVLAQQMKNPDLALKLMDLALIDNKKPGMVFYNRSLVLRGLGRSEEALLSAKKALEAEPKLSAAWDMAGALLRGLGRFEEAKRYILKAVALEPNNVLYCSNLAILHIAEGDLKSAYKAVEESEKLGKDCTSFILGNVLRLAGYPEKAIPHYQRVVRLMPSAHDALMNEAMAWLQIGELKRGFDLFRKRPDKDNRYQNIPIWTGEKTKHLLLYENQGIGDVLQFVRYIPLLKVLADKITLQVHSELRTLLEANYPDLEIRATEDPLPDADARAQLLNLPAIFGTEIKTIPKAVPYLFVQDDWRSFWQKKLAHLKRPLIGFVWAGNPTHKNNHNRSLSYEQITPLLKKFGSHAVSLQKWQIRDETIFKDLKLIDADPYLDDFTKTAGLIMELDLIVSVDTAVAHLAAALGKPVWMLVPFDPDWRWMHGREDSPWYPTLRLFRQTEPRQWASVLSRMSEELEKFIEGEKNYLTPKTWQTEPLRQNPLALALGETDIVS